MIETVTRYLVVCDCCGKEHGHYGSAEEARDFLDDDWTIGNDGTVRCDWCHEHDEHDSCKRHEWDTAGNRNRATLWGGGDDGEPEFQLRSCGTCGHMQKRDRGGDWYGYRHGQWLGEKEAT